MGQKGTHTWDMILHYHRCPQCGFVFENRTDYHYLLGHYQKELTCPRCQHFFTLIKHKKPTFGPLWDQEWNLFG